MFLLLLLLRFCCTSLQCSSHQKYSLNYNYLMEKLIIHNVYLVHKYQRQLLYESFLVSKCKLLVCLITKSLFYEKNLVGNKMSTRLFLCVFSSCRVPGKTENKAGCHFEFSSCRSKEVKFLEFFKVRLFKYF